MKLYYFIPQAGQTLLRRFASRYVINVGRAVVWAVQRYCAEYGLTVVCWASSEAGSFLLYP